MFSYSINFHLLVRVELRNVRRFSKAFKENEAILECDAHVWIVMQHELWLHAALTFLIL